MAVTPPPSRKPAAGSSEPPTRSKLAEKQLNAIINRGSSTVAIAADEPVQLKNFNIRIPADVLATIAEVRARRPRKPTSPKLGISTQDWIFEAIAEKLEREQKKYGTDKIQH